MASAIERLIEAKIQIDKFGFTASSITAQSPSPMMQNNEKRFSNKLIILVNEISIAVEKLNYATYRGKVYKKESSAKYTFSYRCDARAFVHALTTKELNCSSLDPFEKREEGWTFYPTRTENFFRLLAINYDLIKINHGVCW